MNYGNVISESFNIFWKHKSLWIFGIMAALFGQSDYSFRVNYQESVNFPAREGLPPGFQSPFEGTIFANFFDNPIPYIVAGIFLGLIWWVISNIFGWLARGALIGMVDEADSTGSTSLGNGWKTGLGRLLPLFSIALLLALPMLLIIIPAALWAFQFLYQFKDFFITPDPEQLLEGILPTFFSAFACLLPLVCIGALMGFVLNLLNIIAARSCVLENLGVVDSIRRGWQVAVSNIGYTLLNWFLLLALRIIFGFIAAIPALILWIPTARAIMYGHWSAASIASALMMGLYLIIVAVGIGGILSSFNSTLWTKLYKAFRSKEEALETISG
jgi:hypothetical protein